MKATKRQKLIGYMLISKAYRPVLSASTKYVGFSHSGHDEQDKALWLGRAGAIRMGRNPSNSRPVFDKQKQKDILSECADTFWQKLGRIAQKQIIADYPSNKRRSLQ